MAKINISIPDELLDQVDALAAEFDRSRSGLVAEAAARYVAAIAEERERTLREQRIDRAADDARGIGEKFGAIDGVASVREDRDRDRGGEQ